VLSLVKAKTNEKEYGQLSKIHEKENKLAWFCQKAGLDFISKSS